MDEDYRLSYAAKMRVRGKLPQKRDIVDWGAAKLLAFIHFINFFTKEGKFDCSMGKVGEAELRRGDEPFWDEFMERLDISPTKEDWHPAKFRLRLTTFARIPLSWMKSNPHALSQEMLALMDGNPRLAWAAKAFKVVTTEMGVEVVVRDNDETTDPRRMNVDKRDTDVASPLVKFEQAKLSMLTLLQALGKSIPQSELKAMTTKDKIAAFDKLLNTATKVMGQSKPNSIVFSQININKASRDDLEKSFLQYAESQVEA